MGSCAPCGLSFEDTVPTFPIVMQQHPAYRLSHPAQWGQRPPGPLSSQACLTSLSLSRAQPYTAAHSQWAGEQRCHVLPVGGWGATTSIQDNVTVSLYPSVYLRIKNSVPLKLIQCDTTLISQFLKIPLTSKAVSNISAYTSI